MPLVRIDLIQGWSSDYRKTIGGVVYEAVAIAHHPVGETQMILGIIQTQV